MSDVFISYKSERKNAAQHLARILELNGYSVWFDYGLFSGGDFGRQIEREIRASKAVVVLWCSLSRESRWVIEEADLAVRLGTFTPVWLERVDPPLGFTRADTIDLSTWDGAPRSHLLDRLLIEIARRVGRDPVPQFRGLQGYEQTWRAFGAPSLASFALAPAVAEREEARLGNAERERKRQSLQVETISGKQLEQGQQERRQEEPRRQQAEADADGVRAHLEAGGPAKGETEQVAHQADAIAQKVEPQAEQKDIQLKADKEREAGEKRRAMLTWVEAASEAGRRAQPDAHAKKTKVVGPATAGDKLKVAGLLFSVILSGLCFIAVASMTSASPDRSPAILGGIVFLTIAFVFWKSL